jgi:hypothetical protein
MLHTLLSLFVSAQEHVVWLAFRGPEFEFLSGKYCRQLFRDFLYYPKGILEYSLKIGHDRFLPDPSFMNDLVVSHSMLDGFRSW